MNKFSITQPYRPDLRAYKQARCQGPGFFYPMGFKGSSKPGKISAARGKREPCGYGPGFRAESARFTDFARGASGSPYNLVGHHENRQGDMNIDFSGGPHIYGNMTVIQD